MEETTEIKKPRPRTRAKKVEAPKEEPKEETKVEKEEAKVEKPVIDTPKDEIIVKKISHEEAVELSAQKKLIGWNSITKMAKIKK